MLALLALSVLAASGACGGPIDRYGGTIVWTATFERSGDAETEVIINARSGKVLRIERDDD